MGIPKLDKAKLKIFSYNNPLNEEKGFKISNFISEGAFSYIYKCETDSGTTVALKLFKSVEQLKQDLKLENFQEKDLNKIVTKEISNLKKVCGIKRALQLRKAVILSIQKENGEEERLPGLITDFIIGEELLSWLYKDENRSVRRIQKIAYQTLITLKQIHHRQIVHGDIKPENIIIRNGTQSTIIDFGLSYSSIPAKRPENGSPIYLAPEFHFAEKQGAPADIWALGNTLFACCTKSYLTSYLLCDPYAHSNPILREMLRQKIQDQKKTGIFLKTILKNMVTYYKSAETAKAKLQPIIDKIIDNEVGKTNAVLGDLLKNLLRLEPSERLTARKALQHPAIKRNDTFNINPEYFSEALQLLFAEDL